MKRIIGCIILCLLLAGSICGIVYSIKYYTTPINKELVQQVDNYKKQIEQYKQMIEQKEISIEDLTNQVNTYVEENKNLVKSNEELKSNVNNLNLQVQDLNKTINQNNVTIETLNSQIEILENTNNSNLEQIESLNNQIKTLKESNVQYESTVNSLNKTIETLNLQIENYNQKEIELNTEISNLQQSIKDYQAEIENYKLIVEDLKEINSCVVVFKVNEQVVSIQQVGKTDSPEYVEDPTGDFVFEGWIIEGSQEIVDPFTYSVVEDIVFVAKIRTQYNVTFTVNNEIINTQILDEGVGLVLPETPIKDNYTFKGWSLDGSNIIDPLLYEIKADTNFIAVFEIANKLPFTFDGKALTSYFGNDTEVIIPESYSIVDGYFVEGSDYQVTRISNNVFKDNLSVSSVALPDTITYIGESAFEGCSNLISLNFENITDFGRYALRNCINLRELTLSNKIYSSGSDFVIAVQNAFDGLLGLEVLNYNIPELSTSISSYNTCFDDMGKNSQKLTVNIGPDVNILPKGLFTKPVIKFLNFSDSANLTEIQDSCFFGIECDEIVLPEGLLKVGNSAFASSYATKLTLPSTLKSAGVNAFSCYELEKLNYNCVNLTCNDDSNNGSIFQELGRDSSNLKIVFGKSVYNISSKLFSISYFNSIDFAEDCNLNSIGDNAFNSRYSTITSIVLPKELNSIGIYAFYATPITSITLRSNTPPLLSDNCIAENIEDIYIPIGSLNNYIFADNWSAYSDLFIEI